MSLAPYALAASILFAGSAVAASPDLVIPAAAATEGAGGTRWISDVILHNAGILDTPVTLSFHTSAGSQGQGEALLPARSTIILRDIVGAIFGLQNITGSIHIDTDDFLAQKLAVTSRTYNIGSVGGRGEFGQDIPALPVSGSLGAGDTGVITGPADIGTTRFNFGLAAAEDTTILWRLLRNTGGVAGEVEISYTAGTHTQHNNGVSALFSATPRNGDVIHAVIQEGRAYFYGSVINNITGDPSYVPAIRVRENVAVVILGVDLDEDGQADVLDADGNGVLDQPITLGTASFPNFFRIIAEDPEGQPLTYTLVNAPLDATLIDNIGTVQWYPGGDLRGTSGSLTVRVSDGTDSSELIIPVLFR